MTFYRVLTLFIVLSTHTAAAQQTACPDNLGYEGRCNGHVVEWCQDGVVLQFDCGSHGLTCDWVGAEGYDCAESSGSQALPGGQSGINMTGQSPGSGNAGLAFGNGAPAGANNNSGGCTFSSAKAPPTPPLWFGMGLCLLLLLWRQRLSRT